MAKPPSELTTYEVIARINRTKQIGTIESTKHFARMLYETTDPFPLLILAEAWKDGRLNGPAAMVVALICEFDRLARSLEIAGRARPTGPRS